MQPYYFAWSLQQYICLFGGLVEIVHRKITELDQRREVKSLFCALHVSSKSLTGFSQAVCLSETKRSSLGLGLPRTASQAAPH